MQTFYEDEAITIRPNQDGYHYWHYGFDPTAYNWDYYRVDSPGRGTNEESTR